MAAAGRRTEARSFLEKAEQYLASAVENLAANRNTPAAGDAIHAGISAKELKQALGRRPEAFSAERALRELTAAKGEVEYGTLLITAAKAAPLVRRAKTLVDLAVEIVRLGS